MVSTVRPSKKGFVLVVTCIALAILLGMAGLAVDAGRLYVVKSELQAFADAAALSAALELDGTQAGLERARQAPGQLASGEHAMKWDLGTQPIADFQTAFAKGETISDPKTWESAPKGAADYRFVRVIATAQAPLTFMRVLQALNTGFSTVAASGIAVQSPRTARLVQ